MIDSLPVFSAPAPVSLRQNVVWPPRHVKHFRLPKNERKSCWPWPGSAPKPPDLLGNPPPLPELNVLSTKPSRHLLRNLLPKPSWTWLSFEPRRPKTFSLQPDLALHQCRPDLLRNLLRNLLENPVACDPTLCNKASQTFAGTFRTFSGPSLNFTQRLHQCKLKLKHRCSGLKTPLSYAVGEKGCV